MSHEEASELLGAYALDAVDGEELAELEAHLAGCPRCRAELDSLREVAAAMGNSVAPLPEGLWSSIASRLPERHDEDGEPPADAAARTRGAVAVPPARPRSHPRGGAPSSPRSGLPPWPRPPWPSCSASGWCAPTTGSRACSRRGGVSRRPSTAALRAPGHQVVNLDTASHARAGPVRGAARRTWLPGLVDHAPAERRRDLPAVGDRRERADLARPPRRCAAAGRVHHGGRQAAVELEHHRRTGGGSVVPTGPILATGTV